MLRHNIRIYIHRGQFDRGENRSWEMWNEAPGQRWGTSRCQSPGSCLCIIHGKVHCPSIPLAWAGMNFCIINLLQPQREHELHLWMQYGRDTVLAKSGSSISKLKGETKTEEKMLPRSQSSPHSHTLSLFPRISSTFVSSRMALQLER